MNLIADLSPPERTQGSLFGAPPQEVDLTLPGGASIHVRWRFIDAIPQRVLFEGLRDQIPWEQRHLQQPGTWSDDPGRQIPMPRLECWFSELDGVRYHYAGNAYAPRPLRSIEQLTLLLHTVNQATEGLREHDPYNAVFANLYRHGNDSIGWHADNEPVLGPPSRSTIASVSLGSARRFQLKNADGQRVNILLPGGALLWMGPGTQRDWLHQVPKVAKTQRAGPRICLTFRTVHP